MLFVCFVLLVCLISLSIDLAMFQLKAVRRPMFGATRELFEFFHLYRDSTYAFDFGSERRVSPMLFNYPTVTFAKPTYKKVLRGRAAQNVRHLASEICIYDSWHAKGAFHCQTKCTRAMVHFTNESHIFNLFTPMRLTIISVRRRRRG